MSEEQRREITEAESAEFLRKVIRGLMAKYGLQDIRVLALDRFRLRDEVEKRINEHRDEERQHAFREWLFDRENLLVDDRRVIDFRTMQYEPSRLYEGSHQFQKHYFGPRPGELVEKRADGALTAEFKCASHLDSHPSVKYWIRNLPQKPSSFRLQTAKNWFYPDFVCQLQDSRILVVEYKGEHLYAEAENKRLVGGVWESRSGGKCLFVMPTANDFGAIDRKIGPH